jgi:hypothetical protein
MHTRQAVTAHMICTWLPVHMGRCPLQLHTPAGTSCTSSGCSSHAPPALLVWSRHDMCTRAARQQLAGYPTHYCLCRQQLGAPGLLQGHSAGRECQATNTTPAVLSTQAHVSRVRTTPTMPYPHHPWYTSSLDDATLKSQGSRTCVKPAGHGSLTAYHTCTTADNQLL